jgi:predicted RNA binding protein YcfA (HicA-like mRNA interferase family)
MKIFFFATYLEGEKIIKVTIVKVIKGAKILSDLKNDGWYEVHQKGSHRKFKHPTKKGSVTVNGMPSTDFCGDLLKSIENQAKIIF